MKTLIAGLILALLSQSLIAQKAPIKFGEIPIEDLKMKTYAKDTSAAALILADYGQSSLIYTQSEDRFNLLFERITRIKILSKEGLDWATFRIQLYNDKADDEKLSFLKAVTYNLENNKIVETKMKNDAVFKEKASENYTNVNVTLPGVKVGSVVEISYRVMSDFLFHFQDWEFQSTIPIRWSEYRASIPEYYHYDMYTQGYVPLKIVEEEEVASFITISSVQGNGQFVRGQNSKLNSDRLDFKEYKYRWAAEDVPAFKPEPFITTSKDYILKINFELAYQKFPDQPIKPIIGSWEDLSKIFYEHENFGKEITGNGFLKKVVEEITAGLSTPEQKVAAINNFVARNIEWDGNSYMLTIASLKKVLEEKKGSSAELNLMLASMLEKAGFEVSPVLLSTRDHGFVRETIPISSQFNYVVCLVKVNEQKMLLDATDKLLPTGTLPERCLNGNGFVVLKDGAFSWVPLKSPSKSRKYFNVEMAVNPSGELRAKIQGDQSGYYAQVVRKNFLAKGESEFVKQLTENRTWVVEKSEFKNAKEINEGFKEFYDVVISNHAVANDGIIYLNPFVVLNEKENPFKLEKRVYPVDYGSPLEQLYVCKIQIPEGYSVDELPKSIMLKLPDNAAKYLYHATQTGNTVSLTSNLQINNSLFTQDEYTHLREFYTQLVAKQAEQIVFKKK